MRCDGLSFIIEHHFISCAGYNKELQGWAEEGVGRCLMSPVGAKEARAFSIAGAPAASGRLPAGRMGGGSQYTGGHGCFDASRRARRAVGQVTKIRWLGVLPNGAHTAGLVVNQGIKD